MARYQFRLATLQRLREVRRDEQRTRLADAFRAEEALARQRAEVERELHELARWQRTTAAAQHLDVGRMLDAQRYELVLKTQERALVEQEKLLVAEVTRRRQALLEADREVRLLERLDEKQQAAHHHDEQRREAKELDEVAGRQWKYTYGP